MDDSLLQKIQQIVDKLEYDCFLSQSRRKELQKELEEILKQLHKVRSTPRGR